MSTPHRNAKRTAEGILDEFWTLPFGTDQQTAHDWLLNKINLYADQARKEGFEPAKELADSIKAVLAKREPLFYTTSERWRDIESLIETALRKAIDKAQAEASKRGYERAKHDFNSYD